MDNMNYSDECKIYIDNILNSLREKYSQIYLNHSIIKDILLSKEYIRDIDTYINSVSRKTYKLPSLNIIISRSLDVHCIRDFTNSDFNRIESGYFYILELYRYENNKSYELVLMKLDNGEVWLFTEDYDFILIRAGLSSINIDFNLYLYDYDIISANVYKIGYDNITDYVNMFRDLESVFYGNLNSKYKSKCRKFILFVKYFNI